MNFTRESIFVSATRSFCNSFAVVIGVFIAGIVVLMGIMMLSGPDMVPSKSEISLAPDANGNRDLLAETAPAVLRIDIHGVIGEGKLTAENIENILLDSRTDFLHNNRVKAVFLHMDTPGGTVTDADAIYRLLMDYKQKYNVPIYAFVDGLCASGGMYVCSAADKIYATPSSIIGSIGVILGPIFNFSQAMDKIGMQARTLTEGKDKDMLNPFRPWVPGEDQSLVNVTHSLYMQFVDIVVSARKGLNKDRLINEFGAQIFIAEEAQSYGYIEVANSSYNTALKDLAAAANIPESQNYQVVQLETPVSILSHIVQGKSSLITGRLTHVFQIGPHMSSELSGKFLYLYQPQTTL